MTKQPSKYQVRCRLKKGDEVVVTAGKSKGETGKIDSVDRKHGKVFVAGVNLAKRHTRPNMQDQVGGIVDKVMGLDFSNVMLLDPKKKVATRIGFKIEDGKKVRFAKKSGAILD